jgi:hypothetical protein
MGIVLPVILINMNISRGIEDIMIGKKIFKTYLALFIMAPILFSCSRSAEVKSETVSLNYGTDNFVQELSTLNNPRGMMPSTMNIGRGMPGIILKTPNSFYEYFAFDENTVLVVLSISPMYYVKIRSPLISMKFEAEYNQFSSMIYLDPLSKKINGPFEFVTAGGNDVAVVFTPSEISFSPTNSEITISDVSSCFQPGTFLHDSSWSLIYIPNFEDETLHLDLMAQRSDGEMRAIYTNKSDLIPTVHTFASRNLNFPFMYMRSSDGSGDYLILFSNPIGNSDSTDRNFLSSAHGIVLVIRVDKNNSILPFLAANGFDFARIPDLAKTLGLEKITDTSIRVSWTPASRVLIQRKKMTNPDDFSSTPWMSIGVFTGNTYLDNFVEPGYLYYYRICNPDTAEQIAIKDLPQPKDPGINDLVFTEIVFIGSLQNDATSATGSTKHSQDRWFEIKNNTDIVLCLDNVSAYCSGTLIFGPTGSGLTAPIRKNIYPRQYFVIANSMDYIFSEMVISDIAVRSIPSVVAPSLDVFTLEIGGLTSTSQITLDNDIGASTSNGDGTSCFKSKVLLQSGLDWANSQTDFYNINPMSSYVLKNYCTPGRAASGDIIEY